MTWIKYEVTWFNGNAGADIEIVEDTIKSECNFLPTQIRFQRHPNAVDDHGLAWATKHREKEPVDEYSGCSEVNKLARGQPAGDDFLVAVNINPSPNPHPSD